jgi:hypothetical protein
MNLWNLLKKSIQSQSIAVAFIVGWLIGFPSGSLRMWKGWIYMLGCFIGLILTRALRIYVDQKINDRDAVKHLMHEVDAD